MKVAFLDRDGTIITDYPDYQWRYVQEPTFLDGAIDALQRIRAKGFAIIVVTNQYLSGR
jgi:D-glycero-D-manno-heptose 1,7-bisphosphate phosphatase